MKKEVYTKTILLFAIVSAVVAPKASIEAQTAQIYVNARQPLHQLSRYLTGACIEDVNHEVYGGIYSQMIFGESFQEPAASAEPLAGFMEYGGTWPVTNGVLFSASSPGPKLMKNDINLSRGDLKVQVQFPENGGVDAGFIFQVSHPSVGADAFTGYEVSLSPSGYVVLGRHRQGWEQISQVPCSTPTGRWINLEVQYTNASITVLVNGSSLIQYTDTQYPLSSGQVGLRNYQQDVLFRNFQINGTNISFAYDSGNLLGAVSGMWTPVVTGTVTGQYSLEVSNVFVGKQSQRITFTDGVGEIGMANQSLNRWGMNFVAGNEYDGCLDVRADTPTPITLVLESADGSKVYAQTNLLVTGNNWQHLNFSLTPSASDNNGGFAITLTQPGSVVVGYVFLEPGPWGRFAGLPVRKDVAEGLIKQGITVLRYGGSMVNAAGYRWKNMIGPRDQRPPYTGTWYPYSSDGWGIPDFLNFCEAAGFLGVPAVNDGETPQDMADFIEYVNGPADSEWGRQRAADGHPKPYHLKYLEIGNEERVDDKYFKKFKPIAEAIWAKDPTVILVVGDFAYTRPIRDPFNFEGAESGISTLSAQQKILQLAKRHDREVWFDVHVGTDGPRPESSLAGTFSYDDALGQIAEGAKYKVVVFELNADNHSQRRALANALAINAAERDGRLPIVTSANCLQPNGQNNNDWDQGLLFLDPSQVWLQCPGYVTQMISHNYEPLSVESEVKVSGNYLDISAKRSENGKVLVLDVVNLSPRVTPATIIIHGYLPAKPATVEELAGSLNTMNSAETPTQIYPTQKKWIPDFKKGEVKYDFPPCSFTVIKFNK
ncbi:MAG TPA: family 16 glycoside hydrolase [Verrucomicrobiae bacterium]|nr:family 16 glycoside hydrolase [Verrucomicrobiae bacterium]